MRTTPPLQLCCCNATELRMDTKSKLRFPFTGMIGSGYITYVYITAASKAQNVVPQLRK